MQPIAVRPAGRIEGYDTPLQAIRASQAHPRQAKARLLERELEGRRFVDARRDLRQCILEFGPTPREDGPIWLRVFVVPVDPGDAASWGDLVDWTIERQPPELATIDEPLALDWGRIESLPVDLRALAAARRDAWFRQLWATNSETLVYVRTGPILSFHAVRRSDTGELILYVGEAD